MAFAGLLKWESLLVFAVMCAAACHQSEVQPTSGDRSMVFVSAFDLSRKFTPKSSNLYCVTGWLDFAPLAPLRTAPLDGQMVLEVQVPAALVLGPAPFERVRIEGKLSDPGVDVFGPDEFDEEMLVPLMPATRHFVRIYGPMQWRQSGDEAGYWLTPRVVELLWAEQSKDVDWNACLRSRIEAAGGKGAVLGADVLELALAMEGMGIAWDLGHRGLGPEIVRGTGPDRGAALKYLAILNYRGRRFDLSRRCLEELLDWQKRGNDVQGFSEAAAMYLLSKCHEAENRPTTCESVRRELILSHGDSVYARLARARN